MVLNLTGVSTGQLSYSLRKDFLEGGNIFYRETEVYNYELYSIGVSGGTNWSPQTIQQNIYSQFVSQYSGNINVKVFEQPADYFFPNDSLRTSTFNVQIEVKKQPSFVQITQPELSGSYYSGVDYNFFNTYSSMLVDFNENFTFAQQENGNQIFTHDLNFSLLSGNKNAAQLIASGIFVNDQNTTFGISAMVGGIQIANDALFQNYYTETYDTLRNVFSFTKRREILPNSGVNFTYNLNHIFELEDDGLINLTEKGDVKSFISFDQVQNGINTLLGGAYNRCNSVYNTYLTYLGYSGTLYYPLINAPLKTLKTFNKQGILGEYEVSYTNNPEFLSNSVLQVETIEMEVDIMNVVTIRHNFEIEVNRRNMPPGGIIAIMTGISATSPTTANNYYNNSFFFYQPWPLNQEKVTINWPYLKPKGSMTFEYTSNPKKFPVINGTRFNYINVTVDEIIPEDIMQEYKVINRANQLSVLNYAYQTEKGQVNINIEAGLGRLTNEFALGFRNNIQSPLNILYQYGLGIFMSQFGNNSSISFSYFLEDIKYTVNNDGIITVQMQIPFYVKKYLI